MSEDLALVKAQSDLMRGLTEDIEEFIRAARAPATVRAYQSDWKDFVVSFCKPYGLTPLPATSGTVAGYITFLAKYTPAHAGTITRRLTAISQIHQFAGQKSPVSEFLVTETLKGIRRVKGTAQIGKEPMLTETIREVIAGVPDGQLGLRDTALLLIGFAGAFRRSEIAALMRKDASFTPDGLVITLRRSKTDQEGRGREVGIPWGTNPETCPVRALQQWLDTVKIADGPLFRSVDRHGNVSQQGLSPDSIGDIIKRAMLRAGFDKEVVKNFSGHSLRAGHATQAARNGVPEATIMKQTGHKSVVTLRKYIRAGELFVENAADSLGL